MFHVSPGVGAHSGELKLHFGSSFTLDFEPRRDDFDESHDSCRGRPAVYYETLTHFKRDRPRGARLQPRALLCRELTRVLAC